MKENTEKIDILSHIKKKFNQNLHIDHYFKFKWEIF